MCWRLIVLAQWEPLLDALDNVVTSGALKELMCSAHSNLPGITPEEQTLVKVDPGVGGAHSRSSNSDCAGGCSDR